MKNRRWLLASHPEGRTKIEDFTLDEEEISSPPPADHVIIKNKLVSVDPYQRGRISGVDGYAKSYEKGTLVKSLGVGEVVESSSSLLNVGDFVFGEIGWQEYSVLPAKFLRKIDPAICSPLSLALGPLGMVGMTAYFGFVDICNPKEGETVLVSAAAGAVGSLVGQIAKIFGCRVVGTTSSDEKAEFLKSIGYDEVVNYKTCGNLKEAISRACPKGIDIYFDNVGGETLNIAVSLLNRFGRISLCGGISQYDGDYSAGPNITSLIGKEAKIQGFIVSSMFGQRFPEGMAKMGEWVQAGKIQFRETKFEGIESAPKAFISLFESANIGKVVVYI